MLGKSYQLVLGIGSSEICPRPSILCNDAHAVLKKLLFRSNDAVDLVRITFGLLFESRKIL